MGRKNLARIVAGAQDFVKQKDLIRIYDVEAAKAKPVLPPKLVYIPAISLRAEVINDSLHKKIIECGGPEEANAFVPGQYEAIQVGIAGINEVLGYVCAVQYYKIPDKYLPKRGKAVK